MVSTRPNRPETPYSARIQLVVSAADRRISCAAANGMLSTAIGRIMRGIAVPKAGNQRRNASDHSITSAPSARGLAIRTLFYFQIVEWYRPSKPAGPHATEDLLRLKAVVALSIHLILAVSW